MVGLNPDGAARDRVLRLMAEKDRIESEIRDQYDVLEANNIGMNDPLVDDQGYPRGDIDVYKVRHARHRIICLQNDHKNLMKQIERGLAEVHADLMGSTGEHSGRATTSNGHSNGQSNGHISGNGSYGDNFANMNPFAVVTRVDDGSPADSAGLCENDKITIFGSLTYDNFEDMSQIANIVSHSVGQNINVQVKRDRAVVSLNLVPRPWAQPGLLGCHIQRI